MFIEQQICILERFLKDHVTLKALPSQESGNYKNLRYIKIENIDIKL